MTTASSPSTPSGATISTATTSGATISAAACSGATTGPSTSRLAHALNADWARLAADPAVARRVAGWPFPVGGPGRTLADVLAACGGDRDVDLDRADALLAATVALADHDDLAARLVLQRIVPGLVRAARRRGGPHARAAFDELVATVWLMIRTYPLGRRPRRIAANLCRDTEYHAFVRPRRLRSADERPQGTMHDHRDAAPVRDGRPNARRGPLDPAGSSVMRASVPAAADEIRALLADAALAGIDPAGLALVVDLHLAGRHPRVLATEMRISERTVRNRRDAVVRQLARLAA